MLIDSSGGQLVCALAEEGAERVVAEVIHSGEAAKQPIDAVVTELLGHCTVADIYSIVVGTGPGSFIGTRTAISYANGFAAAGQGVQLYGVNSLAAIAAGTGVLPPPPVLRDARRGQWYLWSDPDCQVLDEAGAMSALSAAGHSSVVLEGTDQNESTLVLQLRSAGITVQVSPGVSGEGLLRALAGAEPVAYVEPIYLRGFT